MKDQTFRIRMQSDFGNSFAEIVDVFFKNATDYAKSGNFEDALVIANDAIVIAKYSNDKYSVLYIIGMMCQAYLDNNQPELSEQFFKKGMEIINDADINYERDLNSFLDLKTLIDKK